MNSVAPSPSISHLAWGHNYTWDGPASVLRAIKSACIDHGTVAIVCIPLEHRFIFLNQSPSNMFQRLALLSLLAASMMVAAVPTAIVEVGFSISLRVHGIVVLTCMVAGRV